MENSGGEKLMKRFFARFIILAGVLLITSGCPYREDDEWFIDKSLWGRAKGEKVMSYLKSGDADALKDMFCDELKNSKDFDEKIDEIMNFIDGEILSYDIGGGSGGRGETWEILEPNVYDVETDKGNSYYIYISIYIENKVPEKLGIHFLKILLRGDENEYGVREFIDDVKIYTK
jgi:hypothetical protein